MADQPDGWGPRDGRPRVLIEGHDGSITWAQQRVLEDAGYGVRSCPGPHDLPGKRCPLVTDGRCALVEGTDAILTSLRSNDPGERCVLEALATRDGAPPVAIEVTPASGERLDAVIDAFWQIRAPMSKDGMLSTMNRMIEEGAR